MHGHVACQFAAHCEFGAALDADPRFAAVNSVAVTVEKFARLEHFLANRTDMDFLGLSLWSCLKGRAVGCFRTAV